MEKKKSTNPALTTLVSFLLIFFFPYPYMCMFCRFSYRNSSWFSLYAVGSLTSCMVVVDFRLQCCHLFNSHILLNQLPLNGSYTGVQGFKPQPGLEGTPCFSSLLWPLLEEWMLAVSLLGFLFSVVLIHFHFLDPAFPLKIQDVAANQSPQH